MKCVEEEAPSCYFKATANASRPSDVLIGTDDATKDQPSKLFPPVAVPPPLLLLPLLLLLLFLLFRIFSQFSLNSTFLHSVPAKSIYLLQ